MLLSLSAKAVHVAAVTTPTLSSALFVRAHTDRLSSPQNSHFGRRSL